MEPPQDERHPPAPSQTDVEGPLPSRPRLPREKPAGRRERGRDVSSEPPAKVSSEPGPAAGAHEGDEAWPDQTANYAAEWEAEATVAPVRGPSQSRKRRLESAGRRSSAAGKGAQRSKGAAAAPQDAGDVPPELSRQLQAQPGPREYELEADTVDGVDFIQSDTVEMLEAQGRSMAQPQLLDAFLMEEVEVTHLQRRPRRRNIKR